MRLLKCWEEFKYVHFTRHFREHPVVLVVLLEGLEGVDGLSLGRGYLGEAAVEQLRLGATPRVAGVRRVRLEGARLGLLQFGFRKIQ